MKKKQTRQKKTTTRKMNSSSRQPFLFSSQRFIIIGSCCIVLLLLGVFISRNRSAVVRSVAGIGIMKGMFAEATIPLPQIPEAVSYSIYYVPSPKGVNYIFTNAVSNIPATATSYTISYLKQNTAYVYKISAVGPNGAEIWFSPVKWLTNIHSM